MREITTCVAAEPVPRRAAGWGIIEPNVLNATPAPPMPLEAVAATDDAVRVAPAMTKGGVSNVKFTKVAHDGSADRSESTVLETEPDS